MAALDALFWNPRLLGHENRCNLHMTKNTSSYVKVAFVLQQLWNFCVSVLQYSVICSATFPLNSSRIVLSDI